MTTAQGPYVTPPDPVVGTSTGLSQPSAARGGSEAASTATKLVNLRRIRYYRDLLTEAYESTVSPDRPAGTHRLERLALGIDWPELDAVALWSVRCGDGTVAIPFIEYILARAREAAVRLGPASGDAALARAIDELDEALAAIAPAGVPPTSLPRLEEVYAPEAAIAQLCGKGGVLDRIVACCELLCLA